MSSTVVARASKIIVITTPTKIKLLSCHHLDCPNHWRDFDTTVVKQNKGKTQAQLAALWGENVTQQNISDALQKIGVSRKKRPPATENETT